MADILPEDVHAAYIKAKKDFNLKRAEEHYKDKVHADPGMPHEKLVHRLTNIPKEDGNDAGN